MSEDDGWWVTVERTECVRGRVVCLTWAASHAPLCFGFFVSGRGPVAGSALRWSTVRSGLCRAP